MTDVPPVSVPIEEWESFAPPLDPPTAGGLPEDIAQRIADKWWDEDAFYAAGLMWDFYAGMLDPAAAVASVNTGAQSVTYDPPLPAGEYGRANARAQWYFARSKHGSGGLVSIQLSRGDSSPSDDPLADMSWWIDP